MFLYYNAPTALVRSVSTSLSYDQAVGVMKVVYMGKQKGGVDEVERRTEE